MINEKVRKTMPTKILPVLLLLSLSILPESSTSTKFPLLQSVRKLQAGLKRLNLDLISPESMELQSIRRRFVNEALISGGNADWLQRFVKVQQLVKYITRGEMAGRGFEWLSNITDTFGNRMVGSDRLENAIDFNVAQLKAAGFDNVHTEDVVGLPNWKRNAEEAVLLLPRQQKLAISAVGLSAGGDVEADVVVVASFDELNKLGGNVTGKIVAFNEPWVSYGQTVQYRGAASAAAKFGAVGVLIRSVTPFSIYSPHTGTGGSAAIPAACITIEDAEMLARIQARRQRIRIRMNMNLTMAEPFTSRNTIFELTGTESPHEIVLLSGHFDSWTFWLAA